MNASNKALKLIDRGYMLKFLNSLKIFIRKYDVNFNLIPL